MKIFCHLISITLIIVLLSNCGGGSNGSETTVSVSNQRPIVNAGNDQSVDEGAVVILTGTASDSDGSIATLQWSQINGTLVTIMDSNPAIASFTAPSVVTDETLSFQLLTTDNLGATATDIVDVVIIDLSSTSLKQLNDTGITRCSDGFTISLECPVAGYLGQDASKGRDAQAANGNLAKTGSGRAGFDFTKLDAFGNPLLETASTWYCVKDNVTVLILENKTTDSELPDKNHSYTWDNPDGSINGGQPGVENGAICSGSDCDTHAFVLTVNTVGFCGAND